MAGNSHVLLNGGRKHGGAKHTVNAEFSAASGGKRLCGMMKELLPLKAKMPRHKRVSTNACGVLGEQREAKACITSRP